MRENVLNGLAAKQKTRNFTTMMSITSKYAEMTPRRRRLELLVPGERPEVHHLHVRVIARGVVGKILKIREISRKYAKMYAKIRVNHVQII